MAEGVPRHSRLVGAKVLRGSNVFHHQKGTIAEHDSVDWPCRRQRERADDLVAYGSAD
jgi:hypothetical protein